jgi:hypothetical protein
MPETGTSGSMSGDGKRSDGQRPQVTAPILDSTISAAPLSIRNWAPTTQSRGHCIRPRYSCSFRTAPFGGGEAQLWVKLGRANSRAARQLCP